MDWGKTDFFAFSQLLHRKKDYAFPGNLVKKSHIFWPLQNLSILKVEKTDEILLKLWLSGTLPMEVPFTEVWSGQHLRIAGERRKRRGQGRGWGLSSSLGPCCIGIGNRNRSEKRKIFALRLHYEIIDLSSTEAKHQMGTFSCPL